MNNHYWNGIRSFLAVAEHGSFTQAAQTTGLSKASLSQQVTALEKLLGVQLLHRTTRTLRLTEAGRGYQTLCLRGIEQIDSAREWVVQSNQALSGDVSINAVGGVIGEALIAPLLIEFQVLHPQVNIRLDFSSEKVDLMDAPYDLVVRMGSLPDSSLIARQLHTMTTRYVASPAFLQHHGTIAHPHDLMNLPVVCGSVSEWLMVKGTEHVNVKIQRGFHVANGRVMLQAALAGVGVARLADVYVQSAIAQGTLVEVLPGWQQTTPLSLVCPPARYQLHRVKALSDWLVEQFESRYRQCLT